MPCSHGGHIARIDASAYAKQVLTVSPSEEYGRQAWLSPDHMALDSSRQPQAS